jgi:hypothetical protein
MPQTVQAFDAFSERLLEAWHLGERAAEREYFCGFPGTTIGDEAPSPKAVFEHWIHIRLPVRRLECQFCTDRIV